MPDGEISESKQAQDLNNLVHQGSRQFSVATPSQRDSKIWAD